MQLSLVYNTSVFVVSCEEGSTVIVCENFTCPCNKTLGRRLLQAANDTKLKFVYKQETQAPPNDTAVVKALQQAYSKLIVVTSTNVDQLPTTTIQWDKSIIFYQRIVDSATTSSLITIVAIVVFLVLLIIGIIVSVYCCCCRNANTGSQPANNGSQPANKSSPPAAQFIHVKILEKSRDHLE